MIRNLHTLSLAATASGVVLLFTLMLAMSSQTGVRADPANADLVTASALGLRMPVDDASVRVSTATRARRHARRQVMEARIDARARVFEARMARSPANTSVRDTVAGAVTFAAEVATEAALIGALGALDDQDASAMDAAIEASTEQRRHARRVRGALATPYFSFAQGLRSSGS